MWLGHVEEQLMRLTPRCMVKVTAPSELALHCEAHVQREGWF